MQKAQLIQKYFTFLFILASSFAFGMYAQPKRALQTVDEPVPAKPSSTQELIVQIGDMTVNELRDLIATLEKEYNVFSQSNKNEPGLTKSTEPTFSSFELTTASLIKIAASLWLGAWYLRNYAEWTKEQLSPDNSKMGGVLNKFFVGFLCFDILKDETKPWRETILAKLKEFYLSFRDDDIKEVIEA